MENTIFKSLLEVQKSLQTVGKNKKGHRGTYADLEAVWEAIRGIVNSNGFVVRHEVSAEGIKTVALHESGDKLDSFIPFSGNKDPQEQGKEITYAKRYNINAIFNVIVADEDNDANKPIGNYKKKEVNGKLASEKLLSSKTAEEARKVYNSLSPAERKTDEVVEAIGAIKEKCALN